MKIVLVNMRHRNQCALESKLIVVSCAKGKLKFLLSQNICKEEASVYSYKMQVTVLLRSVGSASFERIKYCSALN